MNLLFANNAVANLATPCGSADTTLNINANAELFPIPQPGEYFVATLSDVTGFLNEIVWVTALNNGVATVIRAQEGTYALAWPANTLFQNLWTAGQAQSFQSIPIVPIGLFSQLSNIYVAPTVTTIYTSGYNVPGVGGGKYVYVPSPGPVANAWTVKTLDGRWFALAENAPNPYQFGAVGDGIASDNAAIQAACDYLPASGGTLLLGTGKYLITGVTPRKNISLVGSGINQSIFLSNNITGRMFDLSVGGNSFQFKADGIRFKNTSGNAVVDAVGLYLVNGYNCTITNCLLEGWFNSVDNTGAWGFYTENTTYWNQKNYAVDFANVAQPDEGDHSIIGCLFANSAFGQAAAAAIHYRSSGGLKITSCKFLDHNRHLWLDPDAGVNTSDLIINGNSFEGALYRLIDCVSTGSGRYQRVHITNNQLAGRGNGFASTDIIHLGQNISHVVVTGNIIEGSGDTGHTGVNVDTGCDRVLIADNDFYDINTAIMETPNGNHVTIGINGYNNVPVYVSGCYDSGALHKMRDGRDRASLYGVASEQTFTNCYQVFVPGFQSCDIDVTVNGVVQGAGGYSVAYRAMFVNNGSTISQTTLLQSNVGIPVDLEFDVSDNASVVAKIRRSPIVDLNFATGALYFQNTLYSTLTALVTANKATFTRSTIGTYQNNDGTITSYPINTPRQGATSFLYEPFASVNLLANSESLQSWTLDSGLTAVANAAVAPDGTSTATQFTSTGSDLAANDAAATVVNGSTYTYSCYYKNAGAGISSPRLQAAYGVTTNGPQTTGSSLWQRSSMTFVSQATSATCRLRSSGSGTTPYDGWGANLVLGSLSSYIPASLGTRGADSLTLNVPNDTYQVQIFYTDGTNQVLTGQVVSGGTGYTIPTLNESYISRLVMSGTATNGVNGAFEVHVRGVYSSVSMLLPS